MPYTQQWDIIGWINQVTDYPEYTEAFERIAHCKLVFILYILALANWPEVVKEVADTASI